MIRDSSVVLVTQEKEEGVGPSEAAEMKVLVW